MYSERKHMILVSLSYSMYYVPSAKREKREDQFEKLMRGALGDVRQVAVMLASMGSPFQIRAVTHTTTNDPGSCPKQNIANQDEGSRL
jgi:hypothetical protein